MNAKAIITLTVACAAVMLILTPSAQAQIEPCFNCPPGPDWWMVCPPGEDVLPASMVRLGVDLDGDLDCVAETDLEFLGPVTIMRHNVGPVIDTEIVSMTLTGGDGLTLIAGAGLGQGGVLPASFGQMEQLGGDPSLIDSFFDVYFELEIEGEGGNTYGYNQTALHLTAALECAPPRAAFVAEAETCLEIYDTPITGGTVIARITFTAEGDFFVHWTYPPGACIDHEANCVELPEFDCNASGGKWIGPGTTCIEAIPAVSEWGLVVMALLGLIAGTIMFRKARAAAA